eukprot:gene2719-3915_t
MKKLFLLFLLLFSFTHQKTVKERVSEFITDPLVNKLVDKINPVKTDEFNDIFKTKNKFSEIKVAQEEEQKSTEISKRATKRCYNAGIAVEYFQGNSTHNSTTQGCVCTLDRYKHDCRSLRTHICTPKLKFPTKNCQFPQGSAIGTSFLSGDHPCLYYHSNDTVDFYFEVSCQFTAPASYLENFPTEIINNFTVKNLKTKKDDTILNIMNNHNYQWISHPGQLNATFAIRRFPIGVFEFRAYNFYALTDESNTWTQRLTADVMKGSPIHFPVWFGNISREFFAGNRLYIDAGDTQLTSTFESFFIDFTNLNDPGAEYPLVDTFKYIGIGTGVGAGVVIIGFALMCFFVNKYGEERELRKNE